MINIRTAVLVTRIILNAAFWFLASCCRISTQTRTCIWKFQKRKEKHISYVREIQFSETITPSVDPFFPLHNYIIYDCNTVLSRVMERGRGGGRRRYREKRSTTHSIPVHFYYAVLCNFLIPSSSSSLSLTCCQLSPGVRACVGIHTIIPEVCIGVRNVSKRNCTCYCEYVIPSCRRYYALLTDDVYCD